MEQFVCQMVAHIVHQSYLVSESILLSERLSSLWAARYVDILEREGPSTLVQWLIQRLL